MSLEQFKIKSTECPVCGAGFDMVTSADSGRPPKPGDISVCFYCASIVEFTEDGMRSPSPERKKQLMRDVPALSELVSVVMQRRGMA